MEANEWTNELLDQARRVLQPFVLLIEGRCDVDVNPIDQPASFALSPPDGIAVTFHVKHLLAARDLLARLDKRASHDDAQ